MKIGMLARCDDRGLGIQTWEFFRHVKPDVTVVVVPSPELSRDFEQFPKRYPGATLSAWDGQDLSPSALEALREVDVIYTAETLYDPRVKSLGPKIVLHINPEFWRGNEGTTAHDVLWVPTDWLRHRAPELGSATLVPIPIPIEFAKPPTFNPSLDLRVMHVHGHRTMGDRNGTDVFLEVIHRMKDIEGFQFKITFADRYWRRNIPPRTTILEYTKVRWDLYDDADVMVLPRRYGGACLPLQEAAARGLALLTPDTSPHNEFPTRRVPVTGFEIVKAPIGDIEAYRADPDELVAALRFWQEHRDTLKFEQVRAREWAERNSWEELLPRYQAELERAAG